MEGAFSKTAYSLTIRAIIPFSIMSYLSSGPGMNWKCGSILVILRFQDMVVIDGINCRYELEVSSNTLSRAVHCRA